MPQRLPDVVRGLSSLQGWANLTISSRFAGVVDFSRLSPECHLCR